MKTYTNRSNANRAGKKQFGAGNFTISGGGREFTVHAKTAAAQAGDGAAKPAKRKKGKARLQDQPQMRKALKLMQRKDGVTVKQGSEALGTNQDTFRGMVSRLRKEVTGITVGREFRVVHYRLDPDKDLDA